MTEAQPLDVSSLAAQIDLKEIQDMCAVALEDLRRSVFPEACKFTLLVRNPDFDDADFLFSTDDLEKAIASLSRFASQKQNQPLETSEPGSALAVAS